MGGHKVSPGISTRMQMALHTARWTMTTSTTKKHQTVSDIFETVATFTAEPPAKAWSCGLAKQWHVANNVCFACNCENSLHLNAECVTTHTSKNKKKEQVQFGWQWYACWTCKYTYTADINNFFVNMFYLNHHPLPSRVCVCVRVCVYRQYIRNPASKPPRPSIDECLARAIGCIHYKHKNSN